MIREIAEIGRTGKDFTVGLFDQQRNKVVKVRMAADVLVDPDKFLAFLEQNGLDPMHKLLRESWDSWIPGIRDLLDEDSPAGD